MKSTRYHFHILAGIVAVAIVSVLGYALARSYVIGQVEKRVRDTMLECRAFHQYVQRDMHPVYASMVEEGRLPEGFYAPELLSSSFITRNIQNHYNRERHKAGLPPISYKMAALDPRNSINMASDQEREVIELFNKDRTRRSYREVVTEDGKEHLLYAQPFLAVEERCLKCHGAPEDAPADLRQIYDWKGGWNLKVGDIVAAEFVRSPLEGEFDAATLITGGFATVLVLAMVLLLFNSRLRTVVARRTKALSDSEDRCRAVIEDTPVMICRFMPSGEITYVNGSYCRNFGKSEEELVGSSFLDLIPEDDRDSVLTGIISGTADCETQSHEHRVISPDGEIRWQRWTNRALFDDQGKPFAYQSMGEDVTERRLAQDALRESEERMELALRGADLGTWDWNVKTGHVAFNDRWAQMLGYSREELKPHVSTWEELVHPDDLHGVMEILDEHLEGGTDSYESEYRMRCKSGGWVWVLDKGRAIERDENGYAVRLCGTHLDITLRRQAEDAHLEQVRFLECLSEIDQVIRSTTDLDEMLRGVMDTVRSLFECDRAWLLYPCDPDAEYCEIPIESASPEYPGARDRGKMVLVQPENRRLMEEALASDLPVVFEPAVGSQDIDDTRAEFDVQAEMTKSIHPKTGSPWLFGIHQCSHARNWTEQEKRLFNEIGRRIADGLTGLLFLHNLEESERKYREIFEGSRDGFVRVAPDGSFIEANQAYCDMLGYSMDELMGGVSFYDITPERWHQWEREEICEKRLLGGGYSGIYEKEYVRKNGEVFPVELQAYAEKGDDGELRYLWAVTRDITVQKRAADDLRESQRSMSTLLSNLPGMAYRCANDKNWTMKFVSEGVLALTGYEAADIVHNRRISYSELIHPDDRESVRRVVQSALDERRPFKLNYRIIAADGSERWVWEQGRGVYEDDGNLTALEGFCADITDRVESDRSRRELETQLHQSQKLEAVGQLAGGVAHDFNNILTAILGNVELSMDSVVSELGSGHFVATAMEQIEAAALRASSLTRQLLTFSRRDVAQPEVLNLNDVLGNLDGMLRRLITEDIALKTVTEPQLKQVLADSGQIEQVVVNLAVNAAHAMPDGGQLTLETQNVVLDEGYVSNHAEAHVGENVLLAVSDTGHGMDAATVERIFEPFFTTKPVDKGTGLGLATVHGIVKQSGGHIMVYSEPGHGSTFKIYLPVVATGESGQPSVTRSGAAREGDETILLCEDDSPVRELIAQSLRTGGYTVLTAGNGQGGIEASKTHTGVIDLLITDVIMPDMNGRALAEELYKSRPGLPTLFISGYTSNVIAHHGVLDDGVEFLEKPFTRRRLLAKVRAVLDAGCRSETDRRSS